MSEKLSGFRFYSLGIVITAKPDGSDIIEVDPIEDFTLDDGKLMKDSRKLKTELPDHKGIVRKGDLTGGSVITARWTPISDSNRETAPDVQPNETVIIYSYADTNDYYWSTLFREPELRRLETVRYVYSNQPSGLAPYGESTSYWTEYSTKLKHIHTHTSGNDGEPFEYDFKINTGEGHAILNDDVGNYLKIDSAITTNTLINADGTYVIEKEEKLLGFAHEYICLSSPTIYLNTPNIVMGYGGCGASTTDSSYHDRPFVRLRDEESFSGGGDGAFYGMMSPMAALAAAASIPSGMGDGEAPPYARIGNAYDSYTHYDGSNRYSFSKALIREESPEHVEYSDVRTVVTGVETQTSDSTHKTVTDDYIIDTTNTTFTQEETFKTESKNTVEISQVDSDTTVGNDKHVDVVRDYVLNVGNELVIEAKCRTVINGRIEIDMDYYDTLVHGTVGPDHPLSLIAQTGVDGATHSYTPFDMDWENHVDKNELHIILRGMNDKLNFLEAERVTMAAKLAAAEAAIAAMPPPP